MQNSNQPYANKIGNSNFYKQYLKEKKSIRQTKSKMVEG